MDNKQSIAISLLVQLACLAGCIHQEGAPGVDENDQDKNGETSAIVVGGAHPFEMVGKCTEWATCDITLNLVPCSEAHAIALTTESLGTAVLYVNADEAGFSKVASGSLVWRDGRSSSDRRIFSSLVLQSEGIEDENAKFKVVVTPSSNSKLCGHLTLTNR